MNDVAGEDALWTDERVERLTKALSKTHDSRFYQPNGRKKWEGIAQHVDGDGGVTKKQCQNRADRLDRVNGVRWRPAPSLLPSLPAQRAPLVLASCAQASGREMSLVPSNFLASLTSRFTRTRRLSPGRRLVMTVHRSCRTTGFWRMLTHRRQPTYSHLSTYPTRSRSPS